MLMSMPMPKLATKLIELINEDDHSDRQSWAVGMDVARHDMKLLPNFVSQRFGHRLTIETAAGTFSKSVTQTLCSLSRVGCFVSSFGPERWQPWPGL